jgi:hypothetical protein
MFDNFRQQYPQGSIISDLVQIHGDQYVVRVSIESSGATLVATLAADANLMLAENRATERALAILGIASAPEVVSVVIDSSTGLLPDLAQPLIEPTDLTVQSLPDLPATFDASSLAEVAIESPLSEEQEFATMPEAIEPSAEVSTYAVEFYEQPDFLAPAEEIDPLLGNGKIDSPAPAISETLMEISTPTVEPIIETAPVAKTSRAKKTTTTPEPVPEMESPAVIPLADPPLSVTDMIPLINMELKRLGWSKERGRDYMVSLYNKRASALLSDEELFGLLQHLRAEPVV